MTRTYRIVAFIAGTYAFSWGIWLGLLALAGAGVVSRDALGSLYGLGGFGPSLAAVLLTLRTDGPGGAGALLRRVFDWRAPLGWYAYALGMPVALRLVGLGLFAATGGALLPNPVSPVQVLVAFVIALVVPLMEEYGWRGYLQPALLQRHSAVRSGLLVGIAWALWHLPLFWFPGTGFFRWAQASGYPLAIGGYCASVVALAMLFTLQYQRTGGNLLLAFLLHDAVNTSADALLAPYARAGLVAPTWWTVLVLLVAGGIATWAVRGDGRGRVTRPARP